MLVATLRWRDEFNIDAALKEEFAQDIYGNVGHIYGKDKGGRPVLLVLLCFFVRVFLTNAFTPGTISMEDTRTQTPSSRMCRGSYGESLKITQVFRVLMEIGQQGGAFPFKRRVSRSWTLRPLTRQSKSTVGARFLNDWTPN
jgi:hypothetical protein